MSTNLSHSESLALPAIYLIKSASDLAALRGPHPLPRSRRRRVRVEIPGVPWEQAKAWEAKSVQAGVHAITSSMNEFAPVFADLICGEPGAAEKPKAKAEEPAKEKQL